MCKFDGWLQFWSVLTFMIILSSAVLLGDDKPKNIPQVTNGSMLLDPPNDTDRKITEQMIKEHDKTDYAAARRNSHELFELFKKGDYVGVLTTYTNKGNYWGMTEKRFPDIQDANQTLRANSYRQLGKGKEAAAEFIRLARRAQLHHQNDKAAFWMSEASKDDPNNIDIRQSRIGSK